MWFINRLSCYTTRPRSIMWSLAALVVLLLTACAGATPASDPSQRSTSQTSVDAPQSESPGSVLDLEGFPAIAPPIPLFDIVNETSDARRVKHLRGESMIPRAPKRIVVTNGTVEILASLGITPVGYIGCCDVPPSAAKEIPGAQFIQVTDGVPLEKVAALQPDLIMGSGFVGASDDDPYAELNKIAPTIAFRISEATFWQESTRQIARLFGAEQRAEEVIADYSTRVAAIRAEIARTYPGGTISPVFFFESTVYLYAPMGVENDRNQPSSYAAWPYHELGLTPGPDLRKYFGTGGPNVGEGYVELSEELLTQLTADNLVVFPNGYTGLTEPNAAYKAFVQRPTWQAVPAVKVDRVFEVTAVNRIEGYYSLLDTMIQFRDAVRARR